MDIVKEVLTLHVIKHDKVGLTVLEQIDELDDVVMLTHLENFDLTTLLEHLDRLHVSLLDCLDRSLRAINLVGGQLHHAELTFPKSLTQLEEVEQIGESHSFQKHIGPLLLFLLTVEIEDT